MRVTSVRDIALPKSSKASTFNLSRKLVFASLEKLQEGRLVITDGQEIFEFGQSASEATVTARVKIYSPKAYQSILQQGVLGCAEAYIHRYWSTPNLLDFIRLMARNLVMLQDVNSKRSPIKSLFFRFYNAVHANTLEGSRKNISAHYDLGNDFFSLFLDKEMMYSSAIFPDKNTDLETASIHKLDTICKKLELGPTDHVVEIGTGWGGFACYAATHYGCKVTTTTISREQYDYAVSKVKELGLEDKVEVLFRDYRKMQGQYDKLVSIEMIEAVGHEFYQEYFEKCSSLLKPDGIMLIQSILVSDQRYDAARRETDFIKRYIFPGGCLPSNEVISHHVAHSSDMQIVDIHDITYDYAKTLEIWRERFFAHLPEVKEQGYSQEFIRMWMFYLCYCQAGFMERAIHTSQIVFAKPAWRDKRYPD